MESASGIFFHTIDYSKFPSSSNYNLKETGKAVHEQRWNDAYEELMAFFADVTPQASVDETHLACHYWQQLLTQLQIQEGEKLCERGFKALAYFPLLAETQL